MNAGSITDAAGNHWLPPASKKGRHTAAFLPQIYQWLSVATLAMASYFVISHFIVQSVQVVGVSMAPTLRDSQLYLLNRWVYYFRAPQRRDVVVLRDAVD